MFNCFNFSVYIRFFVKVLIETTTNIMSELNFSDFYRSLNCLVASKVYMNPEFRVPSFCTRPNVVYTLINLRKNEIHSLEIFLKILGKRTYERNESTAKPALSPGEDYNCLLKADVVIQVKLH